MANQIGTQRVFKGGDGELTSAQKKTCPLCKVQSVPRDIVSTRRVTDGAPKTASGKTHCPNCGHVYGLNKDHPAQ